MKRNHFIIMFQISTAPEDNESTQSTSKSNFDANTKQSTKRKSETLSRPLSPGVKETINQSPKTDKSGMKSSKRVKLLKPVQLLESNEKSPINKNNLTISDNESITIDANIQDVTVERTLTKKHFFKKKKFKIKQKIIAYILLLI